MDSEWDRWRRGRTKKRGGEGKESKREPAKRRECFKPVLQVRLGESERLKEALGGEGKWKV